MLVRAHERFRLWAIAHDVPAAALLRVIHADARRPTGPYAQRMNNLRPWTASYYSLVQRAGFDRAWTMRLDSAQIRPWETHHLAATLSNRAAYHTWRKLTEAYLAERAAKEAADPAVALRTPPPMLAALRASGATAFLLDANLPAEGSLRLTLFGPGAGAPIYAYSRLESRYYTPVHRARGGRAALFLKPFWTVERLPKPKPYRTPRGASLAARRAAKAAHAAAVAAAAAAEKAAAAARERSTHRDTDCNLCGAPRGDVVHICTTCPSTAARRADALGGGRLATMLNAITDALVALHAGQARAPTYLTDAVNALDPASPEAVFIVTRIVTSSPWRVADTLPGWTVAPRLGVLLDRTIKRGSVARLSDAWVRAAHDIISKVGLRWWRLLTPPARAALEAAGHRFPT